MPRIRNSASDPLDFCQDCFRNLCPDEAAAKMEFAGVAMGPDGRGDCFCWNDEHPDYTGEDYVCHACGEPLTYDDN